jgi:hypothetical protein
VFDKVAKGKKNVPLKKVKIERIELFYNSNA